MLAQRVRRLAAEIAVIRTVHLVVIVVHVEVSAAATETVTVIEIETTEEATAILTDARATVDVPAITTVPLDLESIATGAEVRKNCFDIASFLGLFPIRARAAGKD